MKTVELNESTLEDCVNSAETERVIIVRGGRPVAVVVGVAGLDEEQVELGADDGFWRMIRNRRTETTMSRAELERRLGTDEQSQSDD